MNKRKRMATIKHRRRRIRYEAQAKMSDSYTGINTRVIRPRTRPRAVMAPLEEAVAAIPTPVKRIRRVTKQATEHPIPTSSQVSPTTSEKRTRRPAKKTTETTATKPTRRTTKQSMESTNTATAVPAAATATEKRTRRATKQTAKSTPTSKEQRPSQEA